MRKKIMVIVLAAALVAGGLGGLVYAQDLVNKVSAMFSTQWSYDVPGDSFINDEVEGHEDFFAQIENDPDVTEADVTGLTLTLATETEFNVFQEENLAPEYPPYEWDFGDVAEGLGPVAWVGFRGVPQSLVPLTPGFDASRSLSETEFSAPGTQTLTITLTPQEDEVMTEGGWFSIGVGAEENELVNAVITSPTSGEGIQLRLDGHRLDIHPTGLELDELWTITVEIQVTPKVPEIEFMPFVDIKWFGPPSDSGTTSESWLSYTVPNDYVGTWTWSAEPWNTAGSYEWDWKYHMARKLQWQPCSREVIEHEPMRGQKLVGHGAYGWLDREPDEPYLEVAGAFFLTNPDGVSEITIDRISIFDYWGKVVYEGDLFAADLVNGEWVAIPDMEPLASHEQRFIEIDSTMLYLRDQGCWEGDYIFFTVEISWTWTDKEGLPLIGWASTSWAKRDADGHFIEMQSDSKTQMVNLEQGLKPKD